MYLILKKIYIFIILDPNNFQAIQTAMFYKKNASKMLKCNFEMFLDLQRSCDQNKKLNLRKKYLLKVASDIW